MSAQQTAQTNSISKATTQWKNHEHLSEETASQAQQLVDKCGSSERAKEAIEAVADETTTVSPSSQASAGGADRAAEKLNFALAMGFESFAALMDASNRAESNDGQNWYLTPLKDAAWGAWNDSQLLFDRHYATKEKALASIPHDAELTGTAMLS